MTIPNRPHVAIVTSGTRGDVQPALALGKGLKAAGYPVTLIAGSNFAAWIKSHDLDFADIGLDIDEVMATEEARAWKNSNQLTEIYHMKQLFDKLTGTLATSLTRLLPNYDAIITGGTTFPIAAAVAKAKEIPLFHLLKQPMYPTKSGPAYAMPIRSQTVSWLNLLTRPLLLRGFWYAQGRLGMRAANKRLGAPEATYSDFAQAYLNTPTFIAISPPILPLPSDYPSYVHVTGFLFLDQGAGPEPIPRRELSAEALQDGLDTLLGDDSLHGRAQTISQRIREEESVTNIVSLVEMPEASIKTFEFEEELTRMTNGPVS